MATVNFLCGTCERRLSRDGAAHPCEHCGADSAVAAPPPDALIERVEAVAKSRGVSPSSLMRALIAAGLDRSYAALTESEAASDLAAELAALRQRVEDIATSLAADRPS